MHVRDVSLAGQLWEIDGPTSHVTMEGVTAEHFYVTQPSGGVDDMTIKGGCYGPNYVYPDNTIASNGTSNTNTNILIAGVMFHDQSNTVSGAHSSASRFGRRTA